MHSGVHVWRMGHLRLVQSRAYIARILINSARNDIFANLNLVCMRWRTVRFPPPGIPTIFGAIFSGYREDTNAPRDSPTSFCHDLTLDIVAVLTSGSINWIYRILTHRQQEKNRYSSAIHFDSFIRLLILGVRRRILLTIYQSVSFYCSWLLYTRYKFCKQSINLERILRN